MVLDPEGTGIDFSIAHSAGVVAVALSGVYRVGVDVEPAVPRGADPIVWSELSASERARLATAPEAERARWFLRMWTLKEAFVKSTGAGSSMRFDRLGTSFDPPRVVVDGRDLDADVWSWCHQEEWAFEQKPYWLAVTARPGRVLHQLVAAGVDPERHGIPVR